jgi:preprotein translocase subunit SecB
MVDEVVLSPLQMERLLFTKVHVEVNNSLDEDVYAPDFNFEGVDIKTEILSAIKEGQEEDPTNFMVMVRIIISNEPEKSKSAPYSVDVHAQALFYLNPVFPVEKRANIVKVNGSSMIIGAIREVVTQITSRSAYGPLTLPSLRINPTKIDSPSNTQKD